MDSCDPSLWLDMLPKDLCTSIARRVFTNLEETDALNFAKSSSTQAAALCCALGNYFSVDAIEIDYRTFEPRYDLLRMQRRWAKVFQNKIIYLDVNGYTPAQESLTVSLLASPILKRVSMPAEYSLLMALKKSHSVRELRLQMDTSHTFNMVFHVLRGLKLTFLSLKCSSFSEYDDCVLRTAKRSREGELGTFVDFFGLIPHVEVSCKCHWKREDLCAVVSALENIETLSIPIAPRPWEMRTLRNISNMKFTSADISDMQSIAEAGAIVTALAFKRCGTALAEKDITALAACTRMASLDLTVSEGSDAALASCLWNMTGLKTLAVTWRPTALQLIHDPFWDFFNHQNITATPGAVSAAVKSAPNLTKLELSCVCIERTEIEEVLRSMGSQLRFISLSIEYQTESPSERLIAILEFIWKFNPEVRIVRIGGKYRLFEAGELTEYQIMRIKYVLNQLERSSNIMNMKELADFLDPPLN